MNDDPAHIVQVLLGIIGAIFVGIYWDLRARIKGTRKMSAEIAIRVADLEKTSVARDEWDANIERVNKERKEMHQENQHALREMRAVSEAHLARIEDKIDKNEERASKARHDIRDTVHALALKIAVVEKRESR